jgi:hypothetical protein
MRLFKIDMEIREDLLSCIGKCRGVEKYIRLGFVKYTRTHFLTGRVSHFTSQSWMGVYTIKEFE